MIVNHRKGGYFCLRTSGVLSRMHGFLSNPDCPVYLLKPLGTSDFSLKPWVLFNVVLILKFGRSHSNIFHLSLCLYVMHDRPHLLKLL